MTAEVTPSGLGARCWTRRRRRADRLHRALASEDLPAPKPRPARQPRRTQENYDEYSRRDARSVRMTSPKALRIQQTIHAMVIMGPWRLNRLEYVAEWEHCAISNTKILWVYVMEKLTEPREMWRVGSECGPNLEGISDAIWAQGTAGLERSRDHVLKLRHLQQLEATVPNFSGKLHLHWDYHPGWAAGQLTRLETGISPRERAMMGRDISRAKKAFDELQARRARAASSRRSILVTP